MIHRRLTALLVATLLSGCQAARESETPDAASPQPETAEQPFYKTVLTPPAPVLTPSQALEAFRRAPGYALELAAAEPLLEDPVAADWDEDGRLYVTEMRAYMTDTEGTGEERPIGALARLTDVDGDGRFDTRETLLNDLVLPRAVRIVNEGVLVAEMGKLWLCPSASGWSRDIDCARRQLLGAYGEHRGSVEHAENGLLVGLDNWLYSAKSARRLKLVDGQLIEEPTLFRGQWGIAQDARGRLYYNTNSNLLLADEYDAQAVVAAGHRAGPGLGARVSRNDEVFAARVNPGVNRAYLPGVLRPDGRLRSATSASGMAIYQGGRFPSEAPNAFVAEPAANVVAAFRLPVDACGGGSPAACTTTIAADHRLYPDPTFGEREFLASTDERFRPVQVLGGPDGALYVLDFYRGIIQDHVYLSPQLKAQIEARKLDRPPGYGRLWRVLPTEAGEPPALPDWPALDAAALVDRLNGPNRWQRDIAQRLLLRHDSASVPTLLRAAVAEGPQGAALRGLWLLEARGELSAATVATALTRGPIVAEQAWLAGGALLDGDKRLTLLAQVPNGSRAQIHAITALRHGLDDPDTLDALERLLLSPESTPIQRLAAQAAARGAEVEILDRLLAALAAREPSASASQVLAALAQQFFQATGAGSVALLDRIEALGVDGAWRQRALLNGLFEATRAPGFERARLAAPHPLFAPRDSALWPAIARARTGFTWDGDALPADAKPLTATQRVRLDQGAAFYAASCTNCHGADGAGVAALGPPLKDSPWVLEAPERLARIVLQGLSGPIDVSGQLWNSAMPGHRSYPGFDDAVAAGLLTYLRRSWGHSARAIDPPFVQRIRAATADRNALWTAAELNALQLNTHYRLYEGGYGHPARPLRFTYDGAALTIDAGLFKGPLRELKEDHFLFEPRNIRLEFVLDDDGRVNGVRLDGGDGGRLLPRIAAP
ncbi:MAG: c-type cytochrome [Pseudomonadota bacterium]